MGEAWGDRSATSPTRGTDTTSSHSGRGPRWQNPDRPPVCSRGGAALWTPPNPWIPIRHSGHQEKAAMMAIELPSDRPSVCSRRQSPHQIRGIGEKTMRWKESFHLIRSWDFQIYGALSRVVRVMSKRKPPWTSSKLRVKL